MPTRGHFWIFPSLFSTKNTQQDTESTQQYWRNEYNLLLSIILSTQHVTSSSPRKDRQGQI